MTSTIEPEVNAASDIKLPEQLTRRQFKALQKSLAPNRTVSGRMLLAGSVVAAAAIIAKTDLVNIPTPDLTPGQEAGPIVLSDVVIDGLRTNSVDGYGSVRIRVGEITQVYIDKRDSPDDEIREHETLVADDGVFKANWVSIGTWDVQRKGTGALVTLPSVEFNGPVALEDKGVPKINDDKTDRANWQALAGALGASDTQIDELVAGAISTLNEWAKDPEKSGRYEKIIACAAVAPSAEKAKALLVALGVQARVDVYVPRNGKIETVDENLPVVSFRIANPMFGVEPELKPGEEPEPEFLDIGSCNISLDGIGWDNKKWESSPDGGFGMAPAFVKEIKAPIIEQ